MLIKHFTPERNALNGLNERDNVRLFNKFFSNNLAYQGLIIIDNNQLSIIPIAETEIPDEDNIENLLKKQDLLTCNDSQ